eukprot:2666610-Pyramimonas_sp.AAC.1
MQFPIAVSRKNSFPVCLLHALGYARAPHTVLHVGFHLSNLKRAQLIRGHCGQRRLPEAATRARRRLEPKRLRTPKTCPRRTHPACVASSTHECCCGPRAPPMVPRRYQACHALHNWRA